jgi:hypothetical protein
MCFYILYNVDLFVCAIVKSYKFVVLFIYFLLYRYMYELELLELMLMNKLC